MAIHTPGPLYALGTSVMLDRAGLDMTTVVAHCKRRRIHPAISRAEAEANARLFAAAPALAIELKTLIEKIERDEKIRMRDLHHGRELLAKIEGVHD